MSYGILSKDVIPEVEDDADRIRQLALNDAYKTLRNNGMKDLDEDTYRLARQSANYIRHCFINYTYALIDDILNQSENLSLFNGYSDDYSLMHDPQKIKFLAMLFMVAEDNIDMRMYEDAPIKDMTLAYRLIKKVDSLNIDWDELSDYLGQSAYDVSRLFNDETSDTTEEDDEDSALMKKYYQRAKFFLSGLILSEQKEDEDD